MKNPEVTVLMPAFNAGRFISESLHSILRQDFDRFELLVIDDGSTDDTAAIVGNCGDPRVRLLRHERNCGLVATLNEGLREAGAPLVARQDADDLSRRDRLSRQVDYLRTHPGDLAVGSEADLIDEDGRSRGALRLPRTREQLRWDLCFRNPVPHSSVILRRREILEDYGGYPESAASEDYDLWSRLAAAGRFGLIARRLVSYRIHSSSIMMSGSDGAADIAQIRRRNMEVSLGDLTDEAQRDVLLRAWSDPASLEWEAYVPAFEKAGALYTRQHGSPDAMAGIEYQTLLARGAPPPQRLFAALRRFAPQRLTRLPWHRILAARLLRR